MSDASMVIDIGKQGLTNTITKKDVVRECYLLTQ